MNQAQDRIALLSDGVLMKRYAKLMREIELCVFDVNRYVSKDLADAREHFEIEIQKRRGERLCDREVE